MNNIYVNAYANSSQMEGRYLALGVCIRGSGRNLSTKLPWHINKLRRCRFEARKTSEDCEARENRTTVRN